MKQKKISAALSTVGIISSSFLMQACESANSADELNQILESNQEENTEAIGVPVSSKMSKSDRDYISFLQKLSIDIINSPDIAKDFANNPTEYCRKYGYNNCPKIDDAMTKYILALGNKNIISAIQKGDVNTYISECKKEGIINFETLKKDPYLQQLSDCFSSNNIITRKSETHLDGTQNFGIYGVVAIVVAAVAVEAFVVIGTTVWVTHVHDSSNKGKGSKGKSKHKVIHTNKAIELWNLKANDTHAFMAADNINNAIVNEGMVVIKDNFPEIFEKVDKETLRKIILLNVQKNTAYEY